MAKQPAMAGYRLLPGERRILTHDFEIDGR